MKPSVLIVGFGNALAGDDGAGIAVIERLRRTGLPDSVRVATGHTDSLSLPDLWQGEPGIWLVDAVSRGASPGSIHLLDHEEILAVPQRHATVHRLSLPESLRWIAIARPEMKGVRYRLWGIEPELVQPAEGLTPAVGRAVERVAGEILQSLGRSTVRLDR